MDGKTISRGSTKLTFTALLPLERNGIIHVSTPHCEKGLPDPGQHYLCNSFPSIKNNRSNLVNTLSCGNQKNSHVEEKNVLKYYTAMVTSTGGNGPALAMITWGELPLFSCTLIVAHRSKLWAIGCFSSHLKVLYKRNSVSCYIWGSWGTEKESDFPKIIQQTSDRAGNRKLISWVSVRCSNH